MLVSRLRDHMAHRTFGQGQILVVLLNENLKIVLKKKRKYIFFSFLYINSVLPALFIKQVGNTAGFIPNHPFGKGLHELPSNKDFKETASSMVIGILPLRGDAIMGLPILRSVINPLEK